MDDKAFGTLQIPIPASTLPKDADSISLCVSVVPVWPIASNIGNTFLLGVDDCDAEALGNIFTEWSPEWKLQVLENRKELVVRLPLDKRRDQHVIVIHCADPGQIIQKITYQ
jgi:hypothetical protein